MNRFMESKENIAKIEASLEILNYLLRKDGLSQKFHHFFLLYSAVHVAILDTVFTSGYLTTSAFKYERILAYRTLSVIIITFLDESRGYLNQSFQREMADNQLSLSLQELKSHNKHLSIFRKNNDSYFRNIRNLTMAHKKSGIVSALDEISLIDDTAFGPKLIEFSGILKLFYDELSVTAKNILTAIKQINQSG